jgi:hypothetical protein
VTPPRDEGPFSSPVSQRDGTSGCATFPVAGPKLFGQLASPQPQDWPAYVRTGWQMSGRPSHPPLPMADCPVRRRGSLAQERAADAGPLRFVARGGGIRCILFSGMPLAALPPYCWQWHAPCQDGRPPGATYNGGSGSRGTARKPHFVPLDGRGEIDDVVEGEVRRSRGRAACRVLVGAT